MEKPLKIGLIGCGRAAELIHIPALSRVKDARLVAVVDPIPKRRDLGSSSFPGCVAFSSVEKFFQKAEVAAVIIATPSTKHVDVAKMALNAGISVLCEKPLAPSMKGVEELKTIVNSSKGLFMMGFNRRHWKPVNQLRKEVSALRGHVKISIELIMITNKQSWSSIREANDLLDDLGSHQLDLLRYINDCEVSAISARWVNGQEIRMKVKLSGGDSANSLAAYGKGAHEESVTVHCGQKKYRIHAGSNRMQPASGMLRFLLDRSDAVIRNLRNQQSSFEDSYRLQLTNFVSCVRAGLKPQPGISDGIAAIRAVEAARQSSAAHGREVSI